MAHKPNKPASHVIKNGTSEFTDVCKRMRKIRIDGEMTQQQFADAINTTRGNVNQIERGHHAPNIEVMRRVKKKFNVSYDWLLDGKRS